MTDSVIPFFNQAVTKMSSVPVSTRYTNTESERSDDWHPLRYLPASQGLATPVTTSSSGILKNEHPCRNDPNDILVETTIPAGVEGKVRK